MQTNPAVEQNKTLNGPIVRGISPVEKENVCGGNDLPSVCLSVRVSVSAVALTFESPDLESSFLICDFIISRSSLCMKVIGSRSRSQEQKEARICIVLAGGLPSNER